jgi:hypothetical protein
MNTKRLVIGLAMVLGLAGVTRDAVAGEQQLSGSFAGSSVSIALDTNGDGMTAVLSMGRGKTNLGSITFQTVGESAARLPAVNTCPSGHWEFPLLMAHGVLQLDDSGNLLFAHWTSGVTCFDPITATFTTRGKGTFEGGTGKYAKATGSFATTTTGKPLVADRAMHEFDYLAGQVTGTIIIP